MKLVGDGRGIHRTKLSKENKATVETFFKENPGALIKDCIDKTGLSHVTVRKYIKELGI